MITLFEIGDDYYQVAYENGAWLGIIYREVDGYYVFWPSDHTDGFWVSHIIRLIADTLDGMNEEWDKIIQVELADCPEPCIDYSFTKPTKTPQAQHTVIEDTHRMEGRPIP